jgi:probable HAF family extracellular repeat protein
MEHPFLWTNSGGMLDLGTLGGRVAHPDAINDAGEVVGYSDRTGDQAGHAFLWRDGGMLDLGALPAYPGTEAFSINSKGQVVGGTVSQDVYGFIWENEGPMMDLNSLVLPGSPLTVISALLINDNGEIACIGATVDGNSHPCLLLPCDENHPGIEGCDYSMQEVIEKRELSLQPAAANQFGRRPTR